MPHDAALFHAQQIVQHAVAPVLVPVLFGVQAVDKAEVDVVGPQFFELPVHLTFDGLQVGGPAVFARGVVGPEVDLIDHLPAHRGERLPGAAERPRPGGGKVHIVDALFMGIGQRGDGFLFRRVEDRAGAQADHADLLAGFGVDAVFHNGSLLMARGARAVFWFGSFGPAAGVPARRRCILTQCQHVYYTPFADAMSI